MVARRPVCGTPERKSPAPDWVLLERWSMPLLHARALDSMDVCEVAIGGGQTQDRGAYFHKRT